MPDPASFSSVQAPQSGTTIGSFSTRHGPFTLYVPYPVGDLVCGAREELGFPVEVGERQHVVQCQECDERVVKRTLELDRQVMVLRGRCVCCVD